MIHYLHDAAGPLCAGLSSSRLSELEELVAHGRLESESQPDESPTASDLLTEVQRVQRQYTQRFHEGVAKGAHAEAPFRNGADLAEAVGYDARLLNRLPPLVVDTFVGLGNPFALELPLPGERVVDAGCGAGFDVVTAALSVGARGLVFGVDITHGMVSRTLAAAALAGVRNVLACQAAIEQLPLPDSWADRIISNGVLNLGDREAAAREFFRVLRPGGRLQFVDTAYGPEVAATDQKPLDLFNSCRDRRLTCPDWVNLLSDSGFSEVVCGPEFDPYLPRVRRSEHRPRLFAATKPAS